MERECERVRAWRFELGRRVSGRSFTRRFIGRRTPPELPTGLRSSSFIAWALLVSLGLVLQPASPCISTTNTSVSHGNTPNDLCSHGLDHPGCHRQLFALDSKVSNRRRAGFGLHLQHNIVRQVQPQQIASDTGPLCAKSAPFEDSPRTSGEGGQAGRGIQRWPLEWDG